MKKTVIFLCMLFVAKLVTAQSEETLSQLFIKELQNRDYQKMEFLLKKGANINYYTLDRNVGTRIEQETPLMLAIKAQDDKLIEFLLDNGADVNVGKNSSYPINYALKYANKDNIIRLLDLGADPNNAIFSLIKTWDSKILMEEFMKHGADFTNPKLFYTAIDYNRPQSIDFLLNKKVYGEYFNYDYFVKAVEKKRYEIIYIFLKHMPVLRPYAEKKNKSPLCTAIRKRDLKLFRYLEKLGFKQENCTCDGKSLIDYAKTVERNNVYRTGVNEEFINYLVYGELENDQDSRKEAPEINTSLDPSEYKTGTFIVGEKNTFYLVRNDKYQLEYHDKNNWSLKSIKWLDYNNYQLKEIEISYRRDIDTTTHDWRIISSKDGKTKLYDPNYKFDYSIIEMRKNYDDIPTNLEQLAIKFDMKDVTKKHADPKIVARDKYYSKLQDVNCYIVKKSRNDESPFRSYIWRYEKNIQIFYNPSKKEWNIYKIKWNRHLQWDSGSGEFLELRGIETPSDYDYPYITYLIDSRYKFEIGKAYRNWMKNIYEEDEYGFDAYEVLILEAKQYYSRSDYEEYFCESVKFDEFPIKVQKELLKIKRDFENNK